ncbi:hypothetical protein JCM10908_000508 [Rhodotorula pacifica]|uniref:mitochondrial ribosome assembly protein RRG9 n=1 Tax=Rhodotorula pacifica TaxID=1495444 RepID=UPI00317B86E6
MAYRVSFRALIRPACWHNIPCLAPPPATYSAARAHFSHSATARNGAEQATWDTIDEHQVFGRAGDLIKDDPSTPPRAESSSSSSPRPKRVYATRQRQAILEDLPLRVVPAPRRQSGKKKQKAEPAPELPPLDPLPAVEALHPLHLNDLRLWTLRRLGRTPTAEDLHFYLLPWLRTTHRTQRQEREKEQRLAELRAAKKEALDLSWEWDRQVALNSGIERTEREQRKDAIVLRRLERRRVDKLEKAQRDAHDKIRKEQEELDAIVRRGERLAAERKAAAAAAEAAEAAERLKRAPEWKKHQLSLREQFPSGWAPPKRLSREAMDLVRTLHAADPSTYSTAALAAQFKVSPEAIRRILKSRFVLDKEETDRREMKRKEARKLEEVKQGSSSVWGGNVAAETREMEEIRRSGGGEAPRRRRE